MDLEAVLRAIWRRRGRVLLAMVVFAVAVPVGMGFAFSPQYASESQLTVYPVPDASGSVPTTYTQDPDRYVSTQVARISSRAAMAAVAKKYHLSVNDVADMVVVSQISTAGKSDAISVIATSTNASQAAKVSSQLAENYVASIHQQSDTEYAVALKSAKDQLTGDSNQAQSTSNQIAAGAWVRM